MPALRPGDRLLIIADHDAQSELARRLSHPSAVQQKAGLAVTS
ncbi:MAG TPA: hypothetical protein VFU55_10240 [Terracidiphilus sp.]|nr:hypothetical protein [Terracidiphilus sp.]